MKRVPFFRSNSKSGIHGHPPSDLTALGNKSSTITGLRGTNPSRPEGKKTFSSSGPSPQSSASLIEPIPSETCEIVQLCISSDDTSKTNSYLAYHINKLKQQRNPTQNRMDQHLLSALGYLSVKRAFLFQNDHIREVLLQLFKPDGVPPSARLKGSPFQQICIFAVNLLWATHRSLPNWPGSFMSIYLEDSYKNRDWVDHPLCVNFCSNIKMAFGTKPIASDKQTWTSENIMPAEATEVPKNRFTDEGTKIEEYVKGIITEQLNKRNNQDTISRHLVITAGLACGIHEVRKLVSQKLDTWSMNTKLIKVSQEVLYYCCANTTTDVEIVNNILNIRWRGKPPPYYLNALLLIAEQPYIYPALVHRLIKNDFETNRNPSNLNILQFLINHSEGMRKITIKCMARWYVKLIFDIVSDQQPIMSQTRVIRNQLREVAKIIKAELPQFLLELNNGIFEEANNHAVDQLTDQKRKLFLNALVDVVHLCLLLRTHPIREIMLTKMQPHNFNEEQAALYKSFSQDLPQMQQLAIRWVQSDLYQIFRPDSSDLYDILLRFLFLKKEINDFDNWPPEAEKNYLFQTLTAQDIFEGTLTRLAFMGTQFFPSDGLHAIWSIVVRCSENGGRIKVENPVHLAEKILELVLVLNGPQIKLRNLGSRHSLWKCWVVMLLLASQNPSTIGKYGWDAFPQLRLLISFCITGSVMTSPEQTELIQKQSVAERDELLRAESEAAGLETFLNVEDSRYLKEFCVANPSKELRIPPQIILEQITNFNTSIKLDSKLSENRDPDFLLLLMNSNGNSLEWVTKLVRNSNSFRSLPVEVLAEYCINVMDKENNAVDTGPIPKRRLQQAIKKDAEIVKYLKEVAVKPEESPDSIKLLEHLISRLAIENYRIRSYSFNLLLILLNDQEPMEDDHENMFSNLLDQAELGVKLLFLGKSERALKLLIETLYVENDIHKLYIYLLLIENFLDRATKNRSDLQCELILAISFLITTRVMLVSEPLKNSKTENAKNTIDFIIKIIKQISTRIKDDNDDIFMFTGQTVRAAHADFITYKRHTKERNIPTIFFFTVVMVMGMKFEHELAEMWLNAECSNFVTKISTKLKIPKVVADFLLMSNSQQMVQFGISQTENIVDTLTWFKQPTARKDQILFEIEKYIAENSEKNIEIRSKILIVTCLKIHLKNGGQCGQKFLELVEKKIDKPSKFEPTDIVVKTEFLPEEKMEVDEEVPLLTEIESCFGNNQVKNYKNVRRMIPIIKEAKIDNLVSAFMQLASKPDFCKITVENNVNILVNILKSTITKAKRMNQISRLTELKKTIEYRIEKNTTNKIHRLRLCLSLIEIKMEAVSNDQHTIREIIEANRKQPEKIEIAVNNIFHKKSKQKQVIEISHALQSESDERICAFLVDKFIEINYDFMSTSPMDEMNAFFKSVIDQPRLHWLLLNRANWRITLECIHWLLNGSNRCNPSSALDFVWAAERLPMLWRGREISAERCQEYLIQLNLGQMKVYLNHIVDEHNLPKTKNNLQSRINQMIYFLKGSKLKKVDYATLTDFIATEKKTKSENSCWSQLEAQIYLFRPDSISNADFIDVYHIKDSTICATDRIVYRVILDLAEVGKEAEIVDRMRDAHLFCISVANSHPHLMLRHLALLSRLVQGRTHHDFKDFKDNRHLDFFTNFAGVLIVLGNRLFTNEYKTYLKSILDDYFVFLKNFPHQARRQCRRATMLILTVLKNYLDFSLESALEFIKSQSLLWQKLRVTYPDVRDIGGFYQISLDSATINNENKLMYLEQSYQWHPPHDFKTYVTSMLKSKSIDQVITGMNELEAKFEEKGAAALLPFDQVLLSLLAYDNQQVKKQSFGFLLEIIRHEPGYMKEYYDSMLNSIKSNMIVSELMTEFVILAMPKAEEILTKIFYEGCESNNSIAKTIGRTIQLLSLLPAH